MEYFTTTAAASHRSGGCIIVGIYQKAKLGVAAREIDDASGGSLTRMIRQGDLSAEPGKCTVLPSLPGTKAQRIAVVGLGALKDYGVTEYRKGLVAAVNAVQGSKASDVVNYLTLEAIKDRSPYYLARYSAETIRNTLYSFSEMKSGRKKRAPGIRKIGHAAMNRSDASQMARGSEHADAIVEGMSLCRDLGNLPPNVCTPSYIARACQRLDRQHKNVTTKVLSEAEMKRLGMHSLLSVSAGSSEPAKFIIMQYKGAGKAKPVVLVGKGVTFDSGGISLKPGPGMDEMKFDMCGAASVIGTLHTVARLELSINLTVVVPAVENLPGNNATRPGDIVKSMSGQTIEILNTDAEGRLILCDALTYARRFKPELIVDVATLTGACVIALGHHRTAIMSRNDRTAAELLGAGLRADDKAWQLPLADEYATQLRSNFADFANVGGREGGAITAACFLGKFTDGMNWAHLDIAGTAWLSGRQKGATGRPVPLLTEMILARANALP